MTFRNADLNEAATTTNIKSPMMMMMMMMMTTTTTRRRRRMVVVVVIIMMMMMMVPIFSFLSGESVDMILLFSLFALEVIMKASFGIDPDLQRNPDELFIQRAKNVFRTPLWIRAFSMFPFWTYLGRFVNIFPNAGYYIALAERILQQRQQMDSANHKYLIQLMLDAHKVSIICVYKKLLKTGTLYTAIRAI